MNVQLQWQNRSFILNLATINSKDELIMHWERKGRWLQLDKNETLTLLSKDKKYMAVLKKYGDEFCRGYEALIELNKCILEGKTFHT